MNTTLGVVAGAAEFIRNAHLPIRGVARNQASPLKAGRVKMSRLDDEYDQWKFEQLHDPESDEPNPEELVPLYRKREADRIAAQVIEAAERALRLSTV
jgi:hypothetical protein